MTTQGTNIYLLLPFLLSCGRGPNIPPDSNPGGWSSRSAWKLPAGVSTERQAVHQLLQSHLRPPPLPRLGLRKKGGVLAPRAASLPHSSLCQNCLSNSLVDVLPTFSQAEQEFPLHHTLNLLYLCPSVRLHVQSFKVCS